MKIILKVLLLLISTLSFGQGIIGEPQNDSLQEYVELVIVGSVSNMDISGSVNDTIIMVTNTTGHIRVKSGCLTNIAPGSIILIYNSDLYTNIITSGLILENSGDCIYLLPSNSSCLEYSHTELFSVRTSPIVLKFSSK